MSRAVIRGDKRIRERSAGPAKQGQLARPINVNDYPLDDLLNDAGPGELTESEPITDGADESPVEATSDEDFDDGELENGIEVFFERSLEAVPMARPAFLAIMQAGQNRRAVLQNIRLPRFPDQQADLVVKCKILKLIGDFIIREGDLLLNIATSGRDIPIDGNLQQKKLINELQLSTSLMQKNGSRLSNKTLGAYVSKIRRFENIQLPNGKVYSLTQFLRGEGRYAGPDRIELLKYLVGKDKMGDTALSKSFIEDKGKKYTAANKNAVFDEYRKAFFNLKSSVEKHIVTIPKDWQPWESAAFFLSQSGFPYDKKILKEVSILFTTPEPSMRSLP